MGARKDLCQIQWRACPVSGWSATLHAWRPDRNRIATEFLNAFLGSEVGQRQIFLGEEGLSREGLSFEDADNFAIALPNLDEQRAIVAHISAETTKLDALRTATERTISLLKERRASLIAAAVTGRIEVGRGKQ
jgi:type I restriction enzyme S subunit